MVMTGEVLLNDKEEKTITRTRGVCFNKGFLDSPNRCSGTTNNDTVIMSVANLRRLRLALRPLQALQSSCCGPHQRRLGECCLADGCACRLKQGIQVATHGSDLPLLSFPITRVFGHSSQSSCKTLLQLIEQIIPTPDSLQEAVATADHPPLSG